MGERVGSQWRPLKGGKKSRPRRVGPNDAKKKVAQNEKQRQALELRLKGLNFSEIAKELGYKGADGAWKAVQEAMRKTIQEPADEVRKQEIERLDRMQKALWDRVVGGELEAYPVMLKLFERRAKLLGLDAPAKQAFTSPDGDEDHGKKLMESVARDVAGQDALFAALTMAMAGSQQHKEEVDERE
jgi:ATP-dependent Clp protease ATP-binding subunit ClpA